ncbi:MAG TPA: delta-60 repeat domain-containing protein, partial [Steroidobacteraceae bacterium]|nr:delta-60 repeat domain-containing protein [Steroidobacteraceae bacterium]
VHISYADDSDKADDVALQADGKIVIAGNALVGSTADFLIARLNADGSRDTSFGAEGLVTTPFGTLQDFARAVVIQPDGAIVAAGQASAATGADFGLVRLLSDGAFDSSFGGGGGFIVDFFGGSDAARALALQPDGKIVAAGVARNGTSNGVGLVRINP